MVFPAPSSGKQAQTGIIAGVRVITAQHAVKASPDCALHEMVSDEARIFESIRFRTHQPNQIV